jgi:hypothetical protein
MVCVIGFSNWLVSTFRIDEDINSLFGIKNEEPIKLTKVVPLGTNMLIKAKLNYIIKFHYPRPKLTPTQVKRHKLLRVIG